MFQSPDGNIALRMGPGVTAGQYFVLNPDNGGYYENNDDQVAAIEKWKEIGNAQIEATTT